MYDAQVVGSYCEDYDPTLASVVYDHGGCDRELIDLTNKFSMYDHQAKYVLKRADVDLWQFVLQPENGSHDELIPQVQIYVIEHHCLNTKKELC